MFFFQVFRSPRKTEGFFVSAIEQFRKISILLILLNFMLPAAFAQYSPRGTSLNDGYWPNLDEPNKWVIGAETLFDLQRETDNTTTTSFQLSHGHFNWQYGGQQLRGGLQIIYDDLRVRGMSDLSIGAGLTFNRPLFFELGLGYLTRDVGQQSFDGWSFNAKVGYYFRLLMHVKYRFRFRFSLNANYKTIREGSGNREVLSFYPLLGFEFET